MLVVCPTCSHHGNISDKLVPEQGKYVVCPKCKEMFFIASSQIMQGKKQDIYPDNALNVENTIISIPDTDKTQTTAGETDRLHLICPGCGSIVEKPVNLKGNTFHCDYCRSVVVVKIASNWQKQSIDTLLERAQFLEKTGDHIQAYQHYSELIIIDSNNPIFWLGKARTAGYISSYHNQRIPEMLHAFRYAISVAEEGEKEELKKDAGYFIFRRCLGYLPSLKMLKEEAIVDLGASDIRQYRSLHDIELYNLYVIQIVRGMVEAAEYLPHNLEIVNTIIKVCKNELPQFGDPKISNYRNSVLDTFIERKKQFVPGYSYTEKKNKEKIKDFLFIIVCISLLYLVLSGLALLIKLFINIL